MRGVNVNPEHLPAAPTPDRVKAVGFDSVRFILRNKPVSRKYYNDCRDAGLGVLGIVNNETLETYGVTDVVPLSANRINADRGAISTAIRGALSDFPDLVGVECGNEPDGEPPSSWTMDEDAYILFHNLVGDEAFKRSLKICVGGLSSGQTGFFERVVSQLSYDVLMVHPYNKTPAEARKLLRDYAAFQQPGKTIGASEWFPFDREEAAFAKMLDAEAPFGNFFFGWSDTMKPGLGLFDDHGEVTSMGIAMSEHLTGMAPAASPVIARVPFSVSAGGARRRESAGHGDGELADVITALRAPRLTKKARLELADKLEQLTTS